MAIRVLVVDDSVVVRRTVANVLEAAADVEVVGTAADGRVALRKIGQFNPDVVTLDVEMPGVNGLETLREIRKEYPHLPVIMYSTVTERGAAATLEALALGAADYATKPAGATTREEVAEQVRGNLVPLVQLWGRRFVSSRTPHSRSLRPATTPPPGTTPPAGITRPPGTPPPTCNPLPGAVARRATIISTSKPFAAAGPSQAALARGSAAGQIKLSAAPSGPLDLLVIGVSTGGPDALAHLLPMLPAELPVPVAIVQHMPPVFTAMLAKRLDAASSLNVFEAQDATDMRAGSVHLAPGGRHLQVEAIRGGYRTKLTDASPENSCRPAVDVLFRSAARAAGGRVLAVILTGMGQDGLIGSRIVRETGGTVLAQDEATSVVWGMPGFVARDGIARAVLPLDDIAPHVMQLLNFHSRQVVSH